MSILTRSVASIEKCRIIWLRFTTVIAPFSNSAFTLFMPLVRWVMSRFKPLMAIIKAHPKEASLIAALLLLSAIAHAWGIFQFPYYENDEATYVSRAWSFITTGNLDVYTYRYDHAPLGWIFIGIWQAVTGGTLIFGSLLESGRVLMLLLHTASSLLVYLLAKRFTGGSKLAGTVAVIFFALSPLSIYFQRRVLLDNVMTFWILLSLFMACQPVSRLKHYLWSSLFFGIAVLTKLNAIFFAPAYLFLIWRNTHKQHRLHAIVYWIMIAGMVIAGFMLYALLKGEFFAAPLGADGNPTHVSVVDTFALQLGRGDFAWPWDPQSSFVDNIRSWLLKDWTFLVIGTASTLFVTAVGIWRRKTQPYLLVLGAMILLYIAFLARGKIVLDLYVVPQVPLMALAIGAATGVVYRWIPRRFVFRYVFIALLVMSVGWIYAHTSTQQYTKNEISNQLAVVTWVKQHVPKDAVIATDNYLYPYLAQEDAYQHVSYFFNTEYDPEVRATYGKDWRNIEYLVLTHEVVKQIKTGTVPNIRRVLDHAKLLADYRKDTSSYIDLPNYISTNGDWAQVYKVKSKNDIVLQDSWQYFKHTFIADYGQVVDLTNKSLSSSGSQAQAMLRAVAEGDQKTFGGLWQWSKDHLRYRSTDKQLSWKWERGDNGVYHLGDSNSVCDADQQIAYGLFLADERWPGNAYGAEAEEHMRDWWRVCTFVRGGKRLIDSSASGSQDNKLINLGYFRPALYTYMATKLPGLDWRQLINDGYEFLKRVHSRYQTIPNWTVLDLNNSLLSAAPLLGDSADRFGYDALQLIPAIAEHANRTGDVRAISLLKRLPTPAAAFASTTDSPPAHVAQLLLSQALGEDKTALQEAYEKTVRRPYHADQGYWYDKENYRNQVWLWQWHTAQAYLPADKQVIIR